MMPPSPDADHADNSISNRTTLSHPNHKRKGIAAERELLHLFWGTGKWIALRAPASGAIKYPCPDLLVGNASRKLAIECKATKAGRQYISESQIGNLKKFAGIFAAEPWVAVRFNSSKADKRCWFFVSVDDLERTEGSNFAVSKKMAEIKGLSFEEISQTG